MTLHRLFLIALLMITAGLTACGEDSIEEVEAIDPGQAPAWFLEALDEDEDYIYGYATASSKQMQLSLEKARAAAKTRLSQKISETVNVKVRREIASIGSLEEGTEENINKYAEKAELTSDTTIRDAKEYKRKFGFSKEANGYRSFVCVRVRKETVVENVKEALQSEAAKSNPADRAKLEAMLSDLDKDNFFN